MISYDVMLPLTQYKDTLMWQDGLYKILSYLEANRDIYINILSSKYFESLGQCFSGDFYDLIYSVISRFKECDIFKEEYKDFFTKYFMVSLTAIVSQWLHGELSHSVAELVSMLDLMIHTWLLGVRMLPEVDNTRIENFRN